MKRLLTTIVLAGGLAAGGTAQAATAPLPAGCTFEKGTTTCVASESHTEARGTGATCELVDRASGTTSAGVVIELYEVTTRTVTTFKGKNTDRDPLSTSEERTETLVDSTCFTL
jgi:hypothetical protein